MLSDMEGRPVLLLLPTSTLYANLEVVVAAAAVHRGETIYIRVTFWHLETSKGPRKDLNQSCKPKNAVEITSGEMQ